MDHVDSQIQASSLTCNSINVTPIIFPEKEYFHSLLHIITVISAAFVAIGLLFNTIGICICGGLGFKGTLFAKYLGFCLFFNIVLIIATHGRIGALFVYTHAVHKVVDTSCLQMYYFALWCDHTVVGSFCLLCINRIREQHKKHVFDNDIDALRWPFLLNSIIALMCVIPVMHYKISREDINSETLSELHQCVTAFVRPFCNSNEDKFIAFLPLLEYIFLTILLCVLTVEMLYKKRRWKKKANFLAVNKHTYNNLLHPEGSGMDLTSEARRLSATSEFDKKRWVGFLQSAPSNHTVSTNRRSIIIHKSIEPSRTDNQTFLPVAKTNMSLALLIMGLLFRLPRTLIGLTFLPEGSFLYKLKHMEEARLICDLIYQFSLVIPVIVCFAVSPYYRMEAKQVFNGQNRVQDPLLTPQDAKDIYTKLHRRPTWALMDYASNHSFQSERTAGSFQPQEKELLESLTSKVEKISRQRNILDILANVKSKPEYPHLEQFSHTDTFTNPPNHVPSTEPNSLSTSSPSVISSSASNSDKEGSCQGVVMKTQVKPV